jgi:DNA-binding PadR family transcriptional regulator
VRKPKSKNEESLTVPDLVLLSLLAERPMHGYQANLELERRQAREWAGISRPQVYYSLEKLLRRGLLRTTASETDAAGPERHVVATTPRGRAELARALAREDWTTQRERPAFLTWLGLSWQANPGIVRKQIKRRREFLKGVLERERETLASVLQEVGHEYHEAVWMLTLVIEEVQTELRWLDKLERELPHRGRARNPDYAPG